MSADITLNKLQKNQEKEDYILNQIKRRHCADMKAYEKMLICVMEIENELDQQNMTEKNDEGRRRKSHSTKSFEFQGVSHKTAIEDLDEIYDGVRENEKFGAGIFKRNDSVVCIADRKKYKGTITSVNQKGIVIRTKDKRKIRVSWEEIDDEEIKISKINPDEE